MKLRLSIVVVVLFLLIVILPFFVSQVEGSTNTYYPSNYNLLGSTQLVSGSVGNLQSDDGNYMTFRSYPNYDFRFGESLGESSWNTNTVYQDKVVLTFTPPTSADYIVIATAEVQGNCISPPDVKARLYIGASTCQELIYRIKDTTDWYPFCALKRVNLPASSQTLKIQYAISDTTATAKIRNARLYAFSLSSQYAESEAESSWNTNTNWQDKAALTFTPSTSGDYLIIATANLGGSSTDYSTLIQFLKDGIVQVGPTRETSASEARYTFGVMRKVNLDATSHTFKIQYKTENTLNTAYISYAHIVAIRLDQFSNNYYTASEGESGPAAANTWYTKVTNTYTAQAADHLIIGSILYKAGSTSRSIGVKLLQGAAVDQSLLVEHKDSTDYEGCFMMAKASLSAGSTTDKIQYMGENTSARVKNATLISLQLPVQHTVEVEFTGSSNTLDWTQLAWVVDSAWTTPSVTVMLQLYNYNLGQYPTSGDGYISYTSSDTLNTDETQSQTITSNPTHFRDASGNWKIKIKGVKSTTTQFDFKADLVEYKTTTYVAQAPVASFTNSPLYPVVNETVTFNASDSYDPDGSIVSYQWDFGDGNVTTVTNPIVTHIYTVAESTLNYTVTLTVTDNDGLINSTTNIVPVTNPAILRVSLPDGTYVGTNPDKWLDECWVLNITGVSGTFTLKIEDVSGCIWSYDTHLVIALNDAAYNNLVSLTVNSITIVKNNFKYGTLRPYNLWNWPSGDVYPTWFNDTLVNVGTITPKGHKNATVSVTFSNATGVRMHFDAYGSTKSSPIPPKSKCYITHNALSEDSTVLFYPPPVVQYYLTVSSPYGITGGENWYNSGDTAYATLNTGVVEYPNGTRRVFTGWGGYASGTNYAQSDPILMDGPKTAVAAWKTQYKIIVRTIGLGTKVTYVYNDTTILGTATDATPYVDWFDENTVILLDIDSPIVGSPTRYVFTQWTGDALGSGRPASVTSSSPKDITANYKTQYHITVTASPAEALGGTFKVTYTQCGTTYTDVEKTTTWTDWADAGTTVTVSEPQDIINGGSGTRYKFDHYDPSSSVTMDQAKTITLVYKTQYQITVTASPAETLGGTFKVTYTQSGITYTNVQKTTSWTDWADAGTTVTVSGPQDIINSKYKFDHYDPAQSVTMSTAKTVTLFYRLISGLSVSISPTTSNIKVGESVTFTSTVTGGVPGYSYKWYLNGTEVSGAISPTWTFTPVTSGTYNVYLNVTDSIHNTAKSNIAPVTVAPPLKVSISPTSASISVGQSVTFTSTPSGGYPPYSYQWYLGGVQVSGATSSTWTFTPTASGIYYVYLQVKDANNNIAQSETAKITVTPSVPVGGYSISLAKRTPASQIAAYTLLIALFGVALSLRKRKRK